MKKRYLVRYIRWFTKIKQRLNPAIALPIVAIPVLIYVYYYYSYTGQYNGFNFHTFLISANFFLIGALGEEFMFRGFFYRYMINKNRKYTFLLILLQALIFSYFHVNNPGINIIRFLNIFLAGFLLGFIAIKGFLYAVVFHFLWNFMQAYLLGLSVSGYNFTGSLNSIFDAYAWENNILTIIVLGIPVLGLTAAYFKNKKFFV
jgi:membrane protease YdiL (CAAX protease family)